MKILWDYLDLGCKFHVIAFNPGDSIFYINVLPKTVIDYCRVDVRRRQITAKFHLLLVADGLSPSGDKVDSIIFIRETRLNRSVEDLHDYRPLADWPDLRRAAIQKEIPQNHIPGAVFDKRSLCNRPILVYSDEILLLGSNTAHIIILQYGDLPKIMLAKR